MQLFDEWSDTKTDVELPDGFFPRSVGVPYNDNIRRSLGPDHVGVVPEARLARQSGIHVFGCHNDGWLFRRDLCAAVRLDSERTFDRDKPNFGTVSVPDPASLGGERCAVVE